MDNKTFVILTHDFALYCSDRHELLTGVYEFNVFAKHLEKQALNLHKDNMKKRDKYVGDGFELFCEMLHKGFPFDKRLGISNYQLAETDAEGVDGFGVGVNGRPATSQQKYRGDPTLELATKDFHLFPFISQNNYGVKLEDTDNMLVITAGKDIYRRSKEILGGKVRCVGREDIRNMVDNHLPFWDSFRLSWEMVVEKLK